MSVSRIKTWSAGEVLNAVDLNAEFDNLNQTNVAWPLTNSVSAAGYTISNAVLGTLKQLNENVVCIDNYASLPAAITSIGTTVTTLLINKNTNVTTDCTVPSTLTLWFVGQGKLTVSAATTATIDGPVQAGLRQIFAGSGSVAGLGLVPVRSPYWFGVGSDIGTFTDLDTTPSVLRGNTFTVTNSAPTTITTFDDGAVNQHLYLLFTDGNTTLNDSGTLKLNGTFTSTADDMLHLCFNGTNWYEVSRGTDRSGTWTPTVGGTATYTTQAGYYTKRGNVVTIACDLIINTIGTGNSSGLNGTLPYPVKTGTVATFPVSFSSLAANMITVVAHAIPSGTIQLRSLNAAASGLVTQAILGDGSSIRFSGSYLTD